MKDYFYIPNVSAYTKHIRSATEINSRCGYQQERKGKSYAETYEHLQVYGS